jgi:hypothetical protein
VGFVGTSLVADQRQAEPVTVAIVEPAKSDTAPCKNAAHTGATGTQKCAKGPRHSALKQVKRIDRAQAEYSDEDQGYNDNEAPPIGDE